MGSNLRIKETSEYFMDVGLDALIRNYKAGKLDDDIIENCCISLPNTGIHLLPGTCKSNRESFEYEMNSVFVNLISVIEELGHIIFIDVSSGDNLITEKTIDVSDVVVINLSQNISIMDDFFKKYNKLIPRKTFYLIGNYDKNSKYNINNIRRRYHKYINLSNSGVIPYHTKYLDALCDGKVIEYLLENLSCDKRDENWYFINQIKNTTRKLMKMAGVIMEMEEVKEADYELSFVE